MMIIIMIFIIIIMIIIKTLIKNLNKYTCYLDSKEIHLSHPKQKYFHLFT